MRLALTSTLAASPCSGDPYVCRLRPDLTLHRLLLVVLATCIGLLAASSPAFAAAFEGLGHLPARFPFSVALGVSPDGSVVVGQVKSGLAEDQAFRWTASEGMVGLGHLSARRDSLADSASEGGQVVVGWGRSDTGTRLNVRQAFRWTAAEGMVGLGFLDDGRPSSQAMAVSRNGDVIVGSSNSQAFRWTAETGMVSLGALAPGFNSSARDVTSDGSLVVGTANSPDGTQPFLWTQETGMVSLGISPERGTLGLAVSDDGSTVVGWILHNNLRRLAYRWTDATGLELLGDLTPHKDSQANDVSADGAIIVGFANTFEGSRAIIWDEANGMRALQDVLLTEFGLDLGDWELSSATAITPDGRTIVGIGRNPEGRSEAWIVNLAPNEPPDCTQASPSLVELWPPNHDFHEVSVEGVTDPDGDPISITVTDIFQDEALNWPGSGNTCPDAAGVGTDTALLRGERSGASDGRVYHIGFVAEDGQGGECTGTVSICYPHDQGQGSVCIDQGPLSDSTGPCDPGNDADSDGLLDTEEFAIGTHVLNPDTDGDGASDAAELAAGTDPLSGVPLGGAQPVPSLPVWGWALLAVALIAGSALAGRRSTSSRSSTSP